MRVNQQVDYGNVVVNNFFRYIIKINITQKKYAYDNNMVESTLSKWKKGESSPTVDQIKQAAKYFKITVNDLVYDEKEKKNLEILADKSYDPIIAQQSVKVKLYGQFFNKPIKVLIFCVLIFSLFGFLSFILRNNSPYFSLVIILGIPLSIRAIYIHSFDEKTYIINYLDDIYYRRKDSKNKYYFLSLILRILSLTVSIYYITLLQNFELTTSTYMGYLIVLIFLLMLLIFGSITSLTDLPKKFKLKIYDNEIEGYNSSKYILLIHYAIFTVAVMLSIYDFVNYIPFLIVSSTLLILNSIDFIYISFEYAKYVLVYHENDKDPRELFPK